MSHPHVSVMTTVLPKSSSHCNKQKETQEEQNKHKMYKLFKSKRNEQGDESNIISSVR